jgi:AcrR family transcriptional regulator
MSKPDTSIDPRILESAGKEFLSCGFEKASLNSICANAGVTTGAFYKRYPGKAKLFDALVAPVLREIDGFFEQVERKDYQFLDDGALQTMWDMSVKTHEQWIEFLYERYDSMKLLLSCSEGTSHSNFVHQVASRNTKQTMDFLKEIKRRGLPANDIGEDELHILLSAYWSSIFEVIVHDFSKEKALSYAHTLTKFFNWQAVFGF